MIFKNLTFFPKTIFIITILVILQLKIAYAQSDSNFLILKKTKDTLFIGNKIMPTESNLLKSTFIEINNINYPIRTIKSLYYNNEFYMVAGSLRFVKRIIEGPINVYIKNSKDTIASKRKGLLNKILIEKNNNGKLYTYDYDSYAELMQDDKMKSNEILKSNINSVKKRYFLSGGILFTTLSIVMEGLTTIYALSFNSKEIILPNSIVNSIGLIHGGIGFIKTHKYSKKLPRLDLTTIRDYNLKMGISD
jgi:hypothetical protein